MVHKVWLEENNEGKQVDIEFWCPETVEEIEVFDKAIMKLELMNYFIGGSKKVEKQNGRTRK